MALSVSLERLVHAIASAVSQAQHLVEMAQLDNLKSYFNERGEPVTLDVGVPSLHSGGEAMRSDIYRVPLISLVPHGSLVISEASVELDVELGAVQKEPKPEGGYATPADLSANTKKTVNPKLIIDPEAGGLAGKKGGNVAHLTLKLKTAETTEGLARLLNEVIKGQGRLPQSDRTAVEPAVPAA
jgi:hypothetical protein